MPKKYWVLKVLVYSVEVTCTEKQRQMSKNEHKLVEGEPLRHLLTKLQPNR